MDHRKPRTKAPRHQDDDGRKTTTTAAKRRRSGGRSGDGSTPGDGSGPSAPPDYGVIWQSDYVFSIPKGRNVAVYTFVTLSAKDEELFNVRRLINIYETARDQWPRNAMSRSPQEIAAVENTLDHLRVLEGLWGRPERFASKLRSILEPAEKRTFLFRLQNYAWVETSRAAEPWLVGTVLSSKGVE